jgi:hypothetical protein
MKAQNGIVKPGIAGLASGRIREYENATGWKPALLCLEEKQRRTSREEARFLPLFDTLREDGNAGERIVSASHTDDLIIESEME